MRILAPDWAVTSSTVRKRPTADARGPVPLPRHCAPTL